MIGRTNVGGGSQFSATVNITTDPNATITMTNLAGDTFSGIANSSGSLTLVVNKSGTYTVTETDGGTDIVVVADNGETYQATIFGFDGNFIVNGHAATQASALPYPYSTYTAQAPTVTETYNSSRYVVQIETPAGCSGIYLMNSFVYFSDYTTLSVTGWGASTAAAVAKFVFVDEEDNLYEIAECRNNNLDSVVSYPLSAASIDPTKRYKFGIWQYGAASVSQKIQQARFIG